MSGRLLLHLPWLLAVLAAGVWVGDAWFSGGRRAPVTQGGGPAIPDGTSSHPPANGHASTGGLPFVAGCSAVNCHGAAQSAPDANPADRWKSAATIWGADDRHALAWQVLKGDTSKAIIKRLERAGRREPPAEENQLCLGCHSDPSLAHRETIPRVESDRAHGVGCQSCHGRADRWLVPHLVWNESTDRDTEYATHGMTRLYDLNVRAETCAGCHVGAPAGTGSTVNRDVNHDLIAAGHPPLNFEFASHLRRMPSHWHERNRAADNSGDRRDHDFDTRAWSAGQVATLKASLKLLDSRLEASPFPDYSEFDCFDCHHALRPDGRSVSAVGGRRGATAWNRSLELVRLTRTPDDDVVELTPKPADNLQHEMGRFAPNVAVVRRATADLQLQLVHPRGTPADLLEWLSPDGVDLPPLNWHNADWLFHALASIELARRQAVKAQIAELDEFTREAEIRWSEGVNERMDSEFKNLAAMLRIGKPNPQGGRTLSPDFDPAKVRASFHTLIQHLRRLIPPP